MKRILFLFAILLASLPGCAVGPLVSHETARTVGNSHHEVIGGYGMAGRVLKWNYGLTENLDLGFHLESLSIGIRAKYSFLNRNEGWSLATALGTGTSIGGSHYYGDLIGSYLAGAWEPYGLLRLVQVKTDPWEFQEEDTGQISFTIPSSKYRYGQFILGTRYWFNPHWLFSLEASSFFSLSSDLKMSDTLLAGGSLGYRF